MMRLLFTFHRDGSTTVPDIQQALWTDIAINL